MNTISDITGYLNGMVQMITTAGHGKVAGRYVCFEDFVVQNGHLFTARGKLPKGEKIGKAKHCYMNASKLVMRHPNLIYVEGFATSIIPVLHGWCVTKEGEVIDPTWRDGTEYFGVPIKRQYLIKSAMEHGCYGVIDLWKEGWPILHADPSEFKETINLPS